ncbi:baseplate assembly protein [Proteus appendicitidis]|uniref:Baseplate assembly protein n=1 Tax=Proteus appendicitidis TaxID=3034648 RepID=A0ABY8Y2X2_9GAMM|nr:baseplate assembly protein [Proteus sp. HZ0627]WIV86749.1 baseplate assembly protein [Proteus sp. HZ0627]
MPTINLSQLTPPDVIESLDAEQLLRERKTTLIASMPTHLRDAVANTLSLESEPLTKLLEENVYRELLLRQRINESARAVMVAYARGADLDQLAANYNLSRLVLRPANNQTIPPTPAILESDDDLRLRIPAAFEGLSVAGPVGSYEFHARSADGRVSDVSAISPTPANVTISVLSREGDGTASEELLRIVEHALNDEDVRPVADRIKVQSAKIIPYQIDATLFLFPGPESEPIRKEANQRLTQYITEQHRLGRDIRLSAIYAALHVEGVQRVELKQPAKDVVLDKTQASYCIQSTLTLGGSDE